MFWKTFMGYWQLVKKLKGKQDKTKGVNDLNLEIMRKYNFKIITHINFFFF